MPPLLAALFLVFGKPVSSHPPTQDTLRILFIYGSRPASGYEKTERKWFGGIHGGHVAMEIGPDSVLSFRSTEYPCHFFPHRKFSSKFEMKTVYGAWETFPPHNYKVEDLKRLVVAIPITPNQKWKIDSIAHKYLHHTPYDYATAGMRCASAVYEIMAKAGLARDFGSSTWWKIIMPKDLRSWCLKKADSPRGRGWSLYSFPGSSHRVWEDD